MLGLLELPELLELYQLAASWNTSTNQQISLHEVPIIISLLFWVRMYVCQHEYENRVLHRGSLK